jgi:hypothetical protein
MHRRKMLKRRIGRVDGGTMVSRKVVRHLGADDNTLAAGGLLLVHVLVLGGAVGWVVRVSAAGTTAVELDAVTSASDSVALARAAWATRADTGRAGAVGGAAGERGDVGALVGVVVWVVGRLLDLLLGKAAVEVLEGGLVVLGVDNLAGLVWALGLGCDDALWAESAALGDGGGRDAAGLAVWAGGGCLGARLGSGDVDDVKLAASGGLGGVVLSGVVRNVVAVDDVLGRC